TCGEAHLGAADGVVAPKSRFGVSDHPVRFASTPPHEEGNAFVTRSSLVSEFLQVLVVDSEKMRDFMNDCRFHLFFQLLRRFAFILQRTLKNQDAVWIQWLFKETTFSKRYAFIQTE